MDDDIWFANDLNKDGDLNDPGEGLARWASNGTPGSEFTGLYFDPTDKRCECAAESFALADAWKHRMLEDGWRQVVPKGW